MTFIKLNQHCTIERQGEYGWEPNTIYEPVYISVEHIESMYCAGNTSLKMISGDTIKVKESPEEVLSLINGFDDESLEVWKQLGDKP